MTISRAATVDQYLAELPDARRTALARLRALAREHLVGFQEEMRYGMVNFRRSDGDQIAFASQVQYISVYAGSERLDAHRKEVDPVRSGKGCLRFPSPDTIDWRLLTAIFRETASEPSPAPAVPKKGRTDRRRARRPA